MIRMADLAARHADVGPEVEAGVLAVLRSGRWVGGPVVAECERVAAEFFGRKRAVGVNSGTDALLIGLQALGVGPGDEVVVPALSFFATAEAVAALGAVPVVVDVREDACLDPRLVEGVYTAKTRAVVVVHLFGTLAERPNVDCAVIDDAAQAVGGTPPRVVGELTAISTYPTKTWGASGDGGFVIGDDETLVERARQLANHGMDGPAHSHPIWGRNSRLDAVQAAVLLAHAPRVASRVDRRRAIAARYDRELPPSFKPLPRDVGSPVHQYPVRHAARDAVRQHLTAAGVESAIYYPTPMHLQKAIAGRPGQCPCAESMVAELLALPVHEGLTDADVDAVLNACAEVPRW